MASFTSYNTTQPYQNTQFFLQPQGNVYTINSSFEVANVPVSSGISVALCPSEELMYLKSMQNGAPALFVYKFSPYEPQPQNSVPKEFNLLVEKLERVEKELNELKKKSTGGGKLDELI